MHRTTPASRRAFAPLLASLLLVLSACGGGGGGDSADGGGSGSGSGSALTASAGDSGIGGTSSGGTGITQASGPATVSSGSTTVAGAGASPASRTAGRPGDDTYDVSDPNALIVELPGGGNDTVVTSESYQLPPNVENLMAREPGNALVLTGNELDNHIVGSPFVYERIYGLDGNDVLDGGGRHGASIEGGNGNDRLIVSFGTLVGGPGADTFVAAGRGAMTSPDAPIIITDFNGAEGDRIEIYASQAYSSADLFARGILRFDAATNRLVFDLDPSTTAPTSVDQVFILEGVQSFDPAWVTFTVR